MVKRYHSAMARRLGRNIAAFRHRAALTQEQLAYRIDVEIATISRYETASALPSLVTLERLAHSLHCSVADLLDEEAPPRSEEIERIEAMIEPLPLDERTLLVNLLESAVAFVRQRKVGRPRKRPLKVLESGLPKVGNPNHTADEASGKKPKGGPKNRTLK